MTHFKLVRPTAAIASLFGAALFIWMIVTVLARPLSLAQAAPTGGIVGTGTPASCTEAALDAALGGGGTVTFNCGANPYTITLTGFKIITANTTLNGDSKITLSGGGTTRIFWVNTGIRLTLNNLTISNGYSPLGGCIRVTSGTLFATQTTIRNCTGHQTVAFGNGGAIYGTDATIAMTDTAILNNSAENNGGGLYLYGGRATLNNVSVLNNTANYTYTSSGGGIYVTNGALLTMTNSQVNNNHFGYTGQGGGIAAYTSTLNLNNVSVNGNLGQNAGQGGGLYLHGVTATLTALTVSGNKYTFSGGGIDSQQSMVTLNNSQITGNTSSSSGGGINTYLGSLVVNGGSVSGNVVGSDGGGIDLYDTPTLLTNVTISNNRCGRDGGGINQYRNTLTLINVTLNGNINDGSAVVGGQGDGGGVYNDTGTLNISAVTLNNNTAALGGGIYNASDSTSNLTNVTLSANTAITGGGLYNEAGFSDPAIITLTNVTIEANSATDGGGIYNANDPLNSVFLKNTIIADSVGGGDCKGKSMASSKYSLAGDSTCNLVGTGNHNNVNPLLTYLANNGGPTKTHLPKIGSPVINGVIGSDCPSVDQRGVARPQPGGSCDIGSVERAPSDPPYPIGAYVPIILY